MARAYSQDLRERVLKAAARGMSARQAAERFGGGFRRHRVGTPGSGGRRRGGASAGPAKRLQAERATRLPAELG